MVLFDKQWKKNIKNFIVKRTKPHKKRLGKRRKTSSSNGKLFKIFLFSHLLRNVQQPAAPRPLALPIPISIVECDETKPSISVIVSDGMNRKLQTDSTPATVMPTLPIVRELISYVPTVKNVATRGNLIGIPYLGDQFDAEDQHLINSISIEPSKQTKLVRSWSSISFFFVHVH